jgi:protein SCO1/2
MTLRRIAALFMALALTLALPAAASAKEDAATQEISVKVGIEEKLGQLVPLDTVFFDEQGREIALRSIVDKPAVIAPVYFKCSSVCPRLLAGLADVLGKLQLLPGKDYVAVSLSFDETDTPEMARNKRRNFIKAIGKPYPEEAWRFLTGTKENIRKVTDAMGFMFRKEGNDFSHPVFLVILSRDGKVARYINAATFLPYELAMAITEASEGRVSSTTTKALLYCFSYDTKSKKYVFNLLRVFGTVTLLFIISFIIFLKYTGRKRNEGEGGGGHEGHDSHDR